MTAQERTAWTAGQWMAAAKPSSVVGWPVVARPQGRLICNMAYVSPSAEKANDPGVRAFYVEVKANARLIAAAPTMFSALQEAERALRDAEEFIRNGTELGYIRMPSGPDPALLTPGKVSEALTTIRAAMSAATLGEGQ